MCYDVYHSSGVVWEHKKKRGKKHRPFTQLQMDLIEKCYKMYEAQQKIGDCMVQSHYIINQNLEVFKF